MTIKRAATDTRAEARSVEALEAQLAEARRIIARAYSFGDPLGPEDIEEAYAFLAEVKP